MEELIKKYPLAFRSTNGIIWDQIECNDGWAGLLEPVLAYIHNHNKTALDDEQIKVDQIKEKFGTLRFYTNITNKDLEVLISEAEALSAKTCEICGQPGRMRGKSWLYTACDYHTKDKDK